MPLTISEERKRKRRMNFVWKIWKEFTYEQKKHTSPSGSDDDEKGGVSETSGEK